MAFHKTGIIPIDKIKCKCGHDIKGKTICPHCGKKLIPADIPQKISKKKTKSKV